VSELPVADPGRPLVLDEAASLLDPRAARHLERSPASVLTGRMVVAIAYRLHTAQTAIGSPSSKMASSTSPAPTTS